MKYYKDEIKNIKADDISHGERYHVWSPDSIRNFWMIWANNVHLQKQFYPKEYFFNFFNQIRSCFDRAKLVVDVGCGSGTVLSILHELGLGRSLTGIDLSDESISVLEENYKDNSKFSFRVGSLCQLPFEDKTCDVVTCTEVLEHLFPEDIEKGFKEVSRVLCEGGYFLGTIPLGEKINFVVCPECQTLFTPYQHMLFEFTEEYLDAELKKHGLKLIRFIYPVNTSRPKNIIKYILKNKIIIPLFPKISRKLFPFTGVTGFVAQKKDSE